MEIQILEKALTKCSEKVRELAKQVSSLEKELKGEKQLRQTAYYMSAIHRAKSRGSLEPNINCTATAEKFSWQNTAREIINAISE